MSMELDELRAELERVDEKIIALFVKRMALSARIGRVKRATGLPLRLPEREKQLSERYAALAGAELGEYTARLYDEIFTLSRRYQEETDGR